MGATTWLFPRSTVAMQEAMQILAAFRQAAVSTYALYLAKVGKFPEKDQPEIGARWPREGHFLPDTATFLKAIEARNSARTLTALLEAQASVGHAKQPTLR